MKAVSSSARRAAKSATKSSAPALDILQGEVFAGIPWLVHGFSTRQGGVSRCYGGRTLNLGFTEHDTKSNVERNRSAFLAALRAESDVATWPLVQLKQIHSATVHSVSSVPANPVAGDGLITRTPRLLLAVKTADCVPILIADAKRKAIGAFHSGWRGTASRIVQKGIGEMMSRFGSRPQDLRVAIGPCIRRCCYRVGEELRSEFESQFAYAAELFEEIFDANAIHVRYPMLFLNQRAPGHGDLGPEIHLDLVEANLRQLEDAGVSREQVSVIEGCTACDTKRFFSHRAELGKTGRMMAVIGIRAE